MVMDSHARLWSEFASLLRGLKDLNAHALEVSGLRIEVAGAHALGKLDLLGPARLTELAHALALDPSSVSRQVASLERAGLVAREPDPSDRRAARLALTEEGREVVETLRAARARALAVLTPGWSDRDVDELADLLARLNADLDAHRPLLLELPAPRLENA